MPYSLPSTFLQSFLHYTCYTNSAVTNQLHNHLSRKLECLPSHTLKPFFPVSPSSVRGIKLYFPAPPCLLDQLTPFLFLSPCVPAERAVVGPQQLLVAGEDSIRAFYLSVLAVPGAVLAAAVLLLRSQIVAEMQGGRQRRVRLSSLNHSPAVAALCPSFSY